MGYMHGSFVVLCDCVCECEYEREFCAPLYGALCGVLAEHFHKKLMASVN